MSFLVPDVHRGDMQLEDFSNPEGHFFSLAITKPTLEIKESSILNCHKLNHQQLIFGGTIVVFTSGWNLIRVCSEEQKACQ
jgi:hypothetical protein